MSKGLEAFNRIKSYFHPKQLLTRELTLNDLDTIEKELKALEIIKKKDVFVWGFIHRKEEIKDFDWSYDYYKTHYGYVHSGYDYEILTEKEYDLLKEVLL